MITASIAEVANTMAKTGITTMIVEIQHHNIIRPIQTAKANGVLIVIKLADPTID